MGQVLRQDKTGQLTHSAGNIIMAASVASPAYLTIGGRQYTVTSNLSVALPSMTANTRYQVFAVQSGGVVSLVISQNENSVGPAGFLSWKLVGSLYSNGMSPVAFGSFVNIKGTPQTENPIPYNLVIGGTVAAPTLGATAINRAFWSRSGIFHSSRFDLRMTSGGSAGNGIYLFPFPSGQVVDTTRMPIQNIAAEISIAGTFKIGFTVSTGATTAPGLALISASFPNNYYLTYIQTSVETTAAVGSAAYPLSAPQGFSTEIREVVITGWTNTPIEDL
jgi:hypothetical protein